MENQTDFLTSFNKNFDTNTIVGVSPYSYNIGEFTWTINPKRDRYTYDDVLYIIENGTLAAKRELSRSYAQRSFYQQFITHYATLLRYYGLLIANPINGNTKLSDKATNKRYNNAINLIDRANFPLLCERWARSVFVDGVYYGCLTGIDNKGSYIIIDLPTDYCRVRFKDAHGNYLVELDFNYFSTILLPEDRALALAAYPEDLRRAYANWKKGDEATRWYRFTAEESIVFSFDVNSSFGCVPPLLETIPAIKKYAKALDIDEKRAFEEIRHILVQKVPHLTDGTLLFEPPEAKAMHNASCKMLHDNDTVSVLTTYTDVQDISFSRTNDASSATTDRMYNNIYASGGTSKEIYAATGNLSIQTTLKNETSMMMSLANQFASLIARIINAAYGNSNLYFTYHMLPITLYNQEDYVKLYRDLASNGYSFMLPMVALGFSQNELLNLKTLENDILKLQDYLVPLKSSYTATAADSENSGENGAGNPVKEEEKAPTTIQNEESQDGGSE